MHSHLPYQDKAVVKPPELPEKDREKTFSFNSHFFLSIPVYNSCTGCPGQYKIKRKYKYEIVVFNLLIQSWIFRIQSIYAFTKFSNKPM